MTALTPLALNTWISAASVARPAKAITRAEMIAKPAASAAERANQRTTMLLPSPTLRDREGSCGGGLGWGLRGSREARDVGGLLGDEFEEHRGAFAGLGDAALDR